MKERVGETVQIPLFDPIPESLKAKESIIIRTFDGTMGTRGITIALNPSNGEVIRARFIDLLTGNVTSYEPLARGRWSNRLHDLTEDSAEYQKLEKVLEGVLVKYGQWKTSIRRGMPIREWTTAAAKKSEDPYRKDIITPEDYIHNHISLLQEHLRGEEKPKETPVYQRTARKKRGRPKKETPEQLRRSVDREVRTLSRMLIRK